MVQVHGLLLLFFLLLESVGVPASSQCSVHVHVTISTDSYAKIRQRRRRRRLAAARRAKDRRKGTRVTYENGRKVVRRKVSTLNTHRLLTMKNALLLTAVASAPIHLIL